MKIKITTENKVGLSKEVLSLLSENEVHVKTLEVESGQIHIETEKIEKTLERNIASRLMKINGIKWVESISDMPKHEHNLFLASLLNAINDPVFAINNKGKISYQNHKAQKLFNLKNLSNVKDIFTHSDWATKIDTAASLKTPLNIKTIAGSMLVEVRATKEAGNKAIGAALVFQCPDSILKRSLAINNIKLKGFDNLVVKSPVMQDIVNRAKHMSNTPVPLVLYGEPGVGKKTLAQAIHYSGKRKNHLFSSFDCATTPSFQIESELFGLSNPKNNKPGLFEISDGGTVYLKSIQEMPYHCQIKLLKFIESNTLVDTNSPNTKQVNIKIIASSPLNLKSYIQNNKFNSDLFYALDNTNLLIPALSERKEEIESFCNHFLNHFKEHTTKQFEGLSIEALNKIKSFNWPGNILQLKNVLYNAIQSSNESTILPHNIDIDGHIHLEKSLDNRSLPEAVAEFEKHFLQHWYKKHTSTRKLASHLGVSHTTIAQKLNKYRIK